MIELEANCRGNYAFPEKKERRRVGLIYDDRMCKHTTPREENHPESPNRIRVIWDLLNASGIAKRCLIFNGKEASDNHLALVHTKFHIDLIKNISTCNYSESRRKRIAANFNSIYFNHGSSQAAYLAAGSVVEVAEKVAKGELDSAFAIVRPPGHHAEENEPMGFCLYNNVAVATRFLLNERPELGIKKILIVDWDVHHGNGTQNMFYKDPRVLFFSVHRHEFGTFYPAGVDGSYIMTGEGPGAGYNINVPWENGRCGDADYLAVWDHVLLPVAKEFCPDIVIVSAGFDAAIGDPLGGCRVSPYGYSVMLHKLMEFAGGKIVMAFEGGYNLISIANSAKACVEVLLDHKPIKGSLEAYPFESTWRVIQAVRGQIGAYWPIQAVNLPDSVTSKRTPFVDISSSDSDGEIESTPQTVSEEIQSIEDVLLPFKNLKVHEDGRGRRLKEAKKKVEEKTPVEKLSPLKEKTVETPVEELPVSPVKEKTPVEEIPECPVKENVEKTPVKEVPVSPRVEKTAEEPSSPVADESLKELLKYAHMPEKLRVPITEDYMEAIREELEKTVALWREIIFQPFKVILETIQEIGLEELKDLESSVIHIAGTNDFKYLLAPSTPKIIIDAKMREWEDANDRLLRKLSPSPEGDEEQVNEDKVVDEEIEVEKPVDTEKPVEEEKSVEDEDEEEDEELVDYDSTPRRSDNDDDDNEAPASALPDGKSQGNEDAGTSSQGQTTEANQGERETRASGEDDGKNMDEETAVVQGEQLSTKPISNKRKSATLLAKYLKRRKLSKRTMERTTLNSLQKQVNALSESMEKITQTLDILKEEKVRECPMSRTDMFNLVNFTKLTGPKMVSMEKKTEEVHQQGFDTARNTEIILETVGGTRGVMTNIFTTVSNLKAEQKNMGEQISKLQDGMDTANTLLQDILKGYR